MLHSNTAEYLQAYESGFYYLQSRYYDPVVGRFLNADEFASTGQGILGYNMFAYCRNEPVIHADDKGSEDYVIYGDELFSEEFLRSRDGGGGGRFARISCSTPGGSSRLVSISTAQGKVAAQGGVTATGSTTSCSIIGGGHGNPTHSANINTFMSDLANSGNYTTIYGNRALSTAGLNGSYRPDVIAIGRNGVIEVWEFASPSQRYGTVGYTQLAGKIAIMSEMNPGVIFHNIIPW